MSRDIRNCPETVIRTPRWWPSDLPGDGLQTRRGRLGRGDHSFPGEGLGEADTVAAGLADVGVVHELSTVAVARVLGISSSNPDG